MHNFFVSKLNNAIENDSTYHKYLPCLFLKSKYFIYVLNRITRSASNRRHIYTVFRLIDNMYEYVCNFPKS